MDMRDGQDWFASIFSTLLMILMIGFILWCAWYGFQIKQSENKVELESLVDEIDDQVDEARLNEEGYEKQREIVKITDNMADNMESLSVDKERDNVTNKESADEADKFKEMQEKANRDAYKRLREGQDLKYFEITELGKSNNKFYVVIHDDEARYYGIVVISPEEYGRVRLGQKLRVIREAVKNKDGNYFKYTSSNKESSVSIAEVQDENEVEMEFDIIEKFQYFDNKDKSCQMLKLWDSETDTVISIEKSGEDMNLYQIGDKLRGTRKLYGILDNGTKAYLYEIEGYEEQADE